MDGGHDLGGMHGLGPVTEERDEPVFHGEWEKRCFALTLAMGFTGSWNIDMSRHARERMHPADYLQRSYYEIWLHGLTTLLREQGLATDEEMRDGIPRLPPAKVARVLGAGEVADALSKGGPCDRKADALPRFAAGNKVRTRIMHPSGHTRLPRYARGRTGRVERVHGVFVFPDSNAHGGGEQPQYCYSVFFTAADLWGADADPRDGVSLDLWESYLEEVEE